MRYAMIMAGGAGTRLWPVSRAGTPKQLVRFIHRGDRRVSLLELAAERLDGLVEPERRYICTGERFREEIRAVLPDYARDRLLGEPEPRDTLNAVGLAAAVFADEDPDAVFAVLTADHLIEPTDAFQRAIETGFMLVEDDPSRLVTFGIKPTYPATGFGYIEQGVPVTLEGGKKSVAGAFRVSRFVEKPPLHTAQAYVESGQFLWNSGMFVFHAQTFLDALARYKPETHEGLMRIQAAWLTTDRERVLAEIYPTLEKTSVDYGVMEPASKDSKVSIAGVAMDLKWLDVGSWPSYGETLDADTHDNRVAGAELVTHDAKGNLAVGAGDGHTIALLGVEDLIVVHTPDATLVMPRERAQDLKALHGLLDDGLK